MDSIGRPPPAGSCARTHNAIRFAFLLAAPDLFRPGSRHYCSIVVRFLLRANATSRAMPATIAFQASSADRPDDLKPSHSEMISASVMFSKGSVSVLRSMFKLLLIAVTPSMDDLR